MEGVDTLVVVLAASPVPAHNDDGLCNDDDDDDLCVRSTYQFLIGCFTCRCQLGCLASGGRWNPLPGLAGSSAQLSYH